MKAKDIAMASDKIILYIHGKGGNATEADGYRSILPEYDIIGIDYDDSFPSAAKRDIQAAYYKLARRYSHISVLANSIGAYFAMLALQDRKVSKAALISPILDIERLICDMMLWAGVTEEILEKQGGIPTTFGETLSYKYLCYVRDNPICWTVPTEILYAEKDDLTSRNTVEQFVSSHNAHLTVMENGEHWFHTDEQLNFLCKWLKSVF